MEQDPIITQIYQAWLTGAQKEYENSKAEARPAPWCTTVSLVDPHDVAWYPKYSKNVDGENDPPPIPEFHAGLPANFEHWPQALFNENKPTLQLRGRFLPMRCLGTCQQIPSPPSFPRTGSNCSICIIR